MSSFMTILGLVWLAIGIGAPSHSTLEVIGLVNSSVWCVGSMLSSQILVSHD